MKVCSICNKEYDGYGNNAWPFNRDECCTTCNNSIVIPLRIFLSGSIKNQILCINTNRELIYMPVNEEVKLETLQELVNGYIEVYPIKDKYFYYIVNEEGILRNMEYNVTAKEILGIDVYGSVIIVPKRLFK